MPATPSMRPARWRAVVLGWSVLLAVYVGYAATRTSALVFTREATGAVTLTRDGWLSSGAAEALEPAPSLRLEKAGFTGCRLLLVSASSPRTESEIATWGKRSSCSAASASIAAAASALASGAPFRATIPVTGSQIWWPLPLVCACLLLFERQRRATAEALR